jgi:hypothetical protein
LQVGPAAVHPPPVYRTQKAGFEFAQRHGNVAVQHATQLGGAGCVGLAGQYGLYLGWGGVVAHGGFVAGEGQLRFVYGSSEGDQGLGRGGYGDGAPHGLVARVHAPAAAR